uniref:hypothetical protein n=1 Tax=Sulfurovum sp. TaxID=1969726 RepID=UPI0025CC6FC4
MFTLQKNILQIIFTILFSISTFSSLSYAGHQEVGDAVRAIVRGNPTPEQEMIGFVNNTEINLMGVNAQEGQGGITKEIYNAYQRWFHDLNAKFVENAVKKAGFQTELPEYSSLNPGTDTDVPVNAPKGQQITVEDIEKIEKLHLKEIEKYFKKKGVELNGEPDIETDFMGNPDQMTTSEFRKMAYHINHERGGTAYEDPLAAKAQLKLQSGKTPTLEESAAYNREMRRLSTKKLKHGANLREEASEALEEGNLDKARRLTSEARLNEYQAGKYVQRYRACDNALRKRFGLEPKEPTALEGDFETIAAEGRGSGRSAEALNNSRLRIQRINEIIAEDNLETLAHIAEKYPNLAKTAAKAAIENVEAMPADQAKTILKKIQNVKSPDFKVTISEHFRGPSILEKDIAAPTFKVLRVTMVAGMAVLAGNAGVEYTLRHDVDPTDTDLTFIAKSIKNSLWYGSGLGFSADEAIKDQLELYRRALQHGEDPSLLKHMTLMYLRTATYMGRDAVVGLMLLPDTVVEYFTEEKKWKQYTKAQDELASIIHKIVLSKKAFKKVLQQLKKYNIHSEDEIAVLNCLCRDCGGSLGGIFRPEFVGPGYGPCQCNGPLSIWKTAVPTGNKRILNCVNQSALYNGLKNQKIFDQWHNRLNEINAKSVDKEVEEIEKNIAKKDFIAAAKIFKHIEPFIHNRMVKRTYNGKVQGENESYRLHGEIINGLSDQARKEAKDYQDDSLKKAIKNMESATDLDKRYQKRLDKYKKWQRGWDKVVNQELPDIHTRLHDNDIPTAETALINIHDKINRQLLPPRHNDPKIKLADEMLRKKRIEYGAELKKMSQRFFWLKSHSDPRKAVKTETAFFEKWKNQAVDQNNFEREKVKCLQAIKLAQENDKAGDAALSSHNISPAVDHYRTSLRLQKDQKVLDKLNALLKQINIGTDLLKKAREEWKFGNLQEAINIAREADRNNPHDNAISRTLKAMQNQKKQMDDALVKAGKLIEQKKLKKAESVLKKAARINTKYLPYVKMLKKLDGARSVLKKVKHIGNNYKPYIKMVKNMKYAKNKVPRPPKPRNLSYAKSFSGKWNSTYGVMKLTVQGLHVSGNYTHDKGRIEAVLSQDGKTMKG